MTRTILIISYIMLCLHGFSQNGQANDYNNNKLATFQGGDLNTFREWVKTQLQYKPQPAYLGTGERGYVQFVVDTSGQVCNIKVIRSSGDTLLDAAIVRVIKTSPKWIPTKRNGKLVQQSFSISEIAKLLQ